MRRIAWCALVVLGAALVAAERGSSNETLTGPGIIRITSTQSRFTRVDFGRRGASPGDLEISRVRLFNRRVRQRAIGHGQLVCVLTGQNFRNCNGTYILPAGKLVVSGALIYRGLYDLAVTGGTGKYNNVRGTLTVTRI